MKLCRVYLLLGLCVLLAGRADAQEDPFEALEAAVKEAARKVAPSVVQIVTQGGADMVVTSSKGQVFRKALGPTTGVVVDADGYIISSAFNFINNPTNILVTVPGQKEPLVAKRVATDKSRMLTLLKVDARQLAVPAMLAKKDIREGMTAIALGRTLDTHHDAPPSISVGIISAVGRIWSKAIQTDAKISPVNYGGPLIDLQGRVQGILIPASPRGDDETAGFEWYDSGIGFAIPFEDVLAVVPRLKQGKDLFRGLLGVTPKTQDMYSAAVIGQVAKDSAAAKAGLKAGDQIVEIDGVAITRMAQLLHVLGPKYQGDKVSLKYKRADQVKTLDNLELAGSVAAVHPGFLGILPMRDDPQLGVEVRFVYPNSPAEKAGLKAGDRIVKYGNPTGGLSPFLGEKPGRTQLDEWLNTQSVGAQVKLVYERKGGKTDEVVATLVSFPGSTAADEGEIPDKVPQPGTKKQALAPLEAVNPAPEEKKQPPAEKPETGLIKKATGDGEHKYWVYLPDNYDPNIAYSLVVWLHPPGKNKDADAESLADAWDIYCRSYNVILMGPTSENEAGWIPSEADFVANAVREVLAKYTIDRQRVVAHGVGVGGQMAIHLGFAQRELFRGVATVGSVITQAKDNVAAQPLAFYLAVGSIDPLSRSVSDSRAKLLEKHYSATFREIANRGREYLEDEHLAALVRWIDTLDRQ